MKAIELHTPGDTGNLMIEELPIPEISESEILVQIKAVSINPVDVKTRAGKGVYGRLKDIQPLIIGWDIAGVVTKVGTGVSNFKEGDEVFGMVNFPGHGKAYAEYVAAPADQFALKPANISFEEAAAATLAALTAYQAIYQKAKVKPGDKVLIHAAAGGVGHFAVQLAKNVGAYVIGTSSPKNKNFVLSLGADEHADYHGNELEEKVHDVDFCLDAVGGDNIDRSLPLIKKGGTLISIPSGLNETVTEKAKALGINGYFFLVSSNGEDMNKIAKLLESGVLKAHVSQVFNFSEIAKAHQQIESGRTVGKVVVKW
ncbi:NADP-dependent oxidoreductase [Mucilaginibacter limnophilus]|uniref:NADP-dependent oxidoreductase n=1 Tax=Mucilaginibacter limnophilus TaxID=1932778 RepID=A0A437MRS7_9SPHI|nr:NADP-dependent oxidoreductase [Mucilaginibacter limnophilus]RVU00324.1 NADP-dependent oxidoreductase [Mucilaginibacter limnophilus]